MWYLCYGSETLGPMSRIEATAMACAKPDGFAWKEGFENWLPIKDVPALKAGKVTMFYKRVGNRVVKFRNERQPRADNSMA